jgi:hypothetical protein
MVSAGDSEFLTWSLHVPFFCQNKEKSCTWGVPSLSPRAPAGRRDARRPPPGTTVACGGGGAADAFVQESKTSQAAALRATNRRHTLVTHRRCGRRWGEYSDGRRSSHVDAIGGRRDTPPLVSKLAGVASPELHPRIFWSFNPTVDALLA